MRSLITGDSNLELRIGNSAGFSRNFEMPLTCGFFLDMRHFLWQFCISTVVELIFALGTL